MSMLGSGMSRRPSRQEEAHMDAAAAGARRPASRVWLKPILVAFVVITVLELFVFNLPFWQTIGSTPQQTHDDGVGSGLRVETGGIAVVTDPEHAWRDVSASQPIEYLYIDHVPSERPSQKDSVHWRVSTMKSTDSGWYDANADVGYSPSSELSRYSRVGDGSTHVRLRYQQMEQGAVIPYGPITANPRVPMRFSALRLAFELVAALLIILFRPNSPLYRIRLALRRSSSLIPVGICAVATSLVPIALLVMASPQDSQEPTYWNYFASYSAVNQYQMLADAILHGRTWLDYPVNDALAGMSNPYDTKARIATALAHPDVPIFFDVAFHDGRYYSYFGVLPALLLFAPFKAITGMDMATNTALIITATLASAAVTLLAIQLVRLIGRRRAVSLGTTLFGIVAFMFGDGIAFVIQLGLFYQIPQEMAVLFAALGLSLWIEAKLRGLNLPLLASGSLCMALTIACRPQVILATLIAIPLFGDEIIELWRQGMRGGSALVRELKTWSCAIAPYLLVFLPQFAYNQARFGKFTDFGATYNLTGYDMTHMRAPLTQYFSFVFTYLIQPPSITAHFPFIQPAGVPLTTWRSEHAMFGGWFLTAAPFALLLFTIVVWRFALRGIRASGLVAGVFVSWLLAFIVDARITGPDIRYEIDFAFMLMTAFLVLLYAVDGVVNRQDAAMVGSVTDSHGDSGRMAADHWRLVTQRLTFGWLCAGLVAALVFLFFKQYASGMNMPVANWWDTASWFLFM